MHLTDREIGATFNPATGGAERVAADAHAEACVDCQRAVRQAQVADREVADLLHLLDHTTPGLDFASIQAHADVGAHDLTRRSDLNGPARRPTSFRTSPSARTLKTVVRRGTVILGLSAAAVAAALPPVRRLVTRVVGARQTAQPMPAPTRQATTPSVAAMPVAPRGVAIIPDGRADLIFHIAEAGSVLRIHPIAGTRVAVTANADGSTYTVGHSTIVVDSRMTGVTYDIELPTPANLPDVSIRIGGRPVFVRHGTIVHTRGIVAADGSYRISQSGVDPSSP